MEIDMIDANQDQRIVSVQNARTPAQEAAMAERARTGQCPFCVIDRTHNINILDTPHWNVWHNPFPYTHHQNHIVIAHKEHVTELIELRTDAWAELGEIACWAQARFKLPGGAIVMRFGDPDYNAGTIRHLHVHIQVPDRTGPAIAVFGKIDPAKVEEQGASLVKALTPRI